MRSVGLGGTFTLHFFKYQKAESQALVGIHTQVTQPSIPLDSGSLLGRGHRVGDRELEQVTAVGTEVVSCGDSATQGKAPSPDLGGLTGGYGKVIAGSP